MGVAAAIVAVVTVVAAVRALRPGGPTTPVGCGVAGPGGTTFQLSPEQAQNATIEAAVAYREGLPDHAVTVALAASLQESLLRNLPYGDADSVGLFQQRPSQGWGTRAQLLDPVYATTAFYHGLARIPGWEAMPVTVAAQSVQRSAAPDAYATWEAEARALAVAFTGEVPAGLSCHFPAFTGALPPTGALGAAAARELGRNLLGVDVPPTTGWRVASWAQAHAAAYHIQQLRFSGWTWTPGGDAWARPAQGAAGTPAAGAVTVIYARK